MARSPGGGGVHGAESCPRGVHGRSGRTAAIPLRSGGRPTLPLLLDTRRRTSPAPLGADRGRFEGDIPLMTVMTKTDIPLVDLKAQYRTIRDEVRPAIAAVLEGMQLDRGPSVRACDGARSAVCGGGRAIGVGRGREALQRAARALGGSASWTASVPLPTP